MDFSQNKSKYFKTFLASSGFLFGAVGTQLFGVKEALVFFGNENTSLEIVAGILTIASVAYMMGFSRVPKVYTMINSNSTTIKASINRNDAESGRAHRPKEYSQPSTSSERTKEIVIKIAFGIVIGSFTAILQKGLVGYLGAETLLRTMPTKNHTFIKYLVPIFSTYIAGSSSIAYFAYMFKKSLANITKILTCKKILNETNIEYKAKIKALVSTIAIIIVVSAPTYMLFNFLQRNAFDVAIGVNNLSTNCKKILSGLAAFTTVMTGMTAKSPIFYQRLYTFFSNTENNKVSASLSNTNRNGMSLLRNAFNYSVGFLYITTFSLSCYIATENFCKNNNADFLKWEIQLSTVAFIVGASLLEWAFTVMPVVDYWKKPTLEDNQGLKEYTPLLFQKKDSENHRVDINNDPEEIEYSDSLETFNSPGT